MFAFINLPIEIQNKIFLYHQSPIAQMLKELLNSYKDYEGILYDVKDEIILPSGLKIMLITSGKITV